MTKSTPESRQRLALALLWFTPALWAVNYLVARTAPGVITPHVLALGRWALAGAILLSLSHREIWRHRTALATQWPHYLVLGALGMMICGAWVYLGAQTTSAINIALIYAASPVLIALGAMLWLGESMRLRQMLGVALALTGVLHVVLKGQWLSLSAVQWVAGDGWIVLAMIAWAGYALLQKKWTSPLGSTARLAMICAGGVLTLVPGALFELWHTPMVWTPLALGLILTAGLLPGVCAYWSYGFAQKTLGASRVAASLYMGPLYGALLSWGVLGEPLGLHHLGGALLILPGIWLASRSVPAAPEPV